MTTKPVLRVLIFLYARISEDPRDLKRGVKRQLADLRRYAVEDLGGEIAGEFTENDVSAHADVERPEYDSVMAAAIAAARPGVKVIVAAYHPSRLWRRPVERAQAIEDLRRAGVWVGFESGGLFNLARATDRSQLRQVGESDTQESEVKSERVSRAALERAQEGKSNGKVAYGWKRVYTYDARGQVDGFSDVEDPEQAPVVREIVQRLLGGESLISITQRLNERGIPSPGAGVNRRSRTQIQDADGTRWGKSSVKKIATRDMNVALRTHNGEQYPAEWPRLIPDEDHARVKALFAARSVTREKPGQRKHLLTWGDVATCGICGSWLRVGIRGNTRYGKRKELYLCDAEEHVGRSKEHLDAYVSDLAIERLERPDVLALLAPADDDAVPKILVRISGLVARQAEAADGFAEGDLTREQLRRINANLGQQLDEARHELAAAQPKVDVGVVAAVAGPDARERWELLDVVRQRKVLEALGLRLKINKVTRRGPGFDPESVSFPDDRPFGPR